MKRCVMSLLLLTVATAQAEAHFIWIIPGKPEAEKVMAQVIFSDSLQPDSPDLLAKIAKTQLFVRTAEDKTEPVKWSEGKDAYTVTISKGPSAVGGVCKYGVVQFGKADPFLLVYYPKGLIGSTPGETPLYQKAWDRLALEILPAKDRGKDAFVVFWQGKPLADAEVVILCPGKEKSAECKTDKQGEFKVDQSEKGIYGIRVRHIEAKEGEYEGKKYQTVRHYATLAFEITEAAPQKKKGDAGQSGELKQASAFAPLPKAVSSFGAVVSDGWLYVYGGHSGKTHQYSTETVIGTFHRLKLSDPAAWEELPSGPASQGLALVAYQGKIYRIGGMQPRNQPGEKADNHSLTTCERYDPERKKWEPLPDLPEGRSSHDAVVVGDKLVVIGGWKMNGAGKKAEWHTTALILDLKQKPMKWETVKQPLQRRALTTAAYDGKVYVIGGLTEDAGAVLTVNIYDPAKNAWTTGPDIPGPQRNGFTPASCVTGGRLYVSPADGKMYRLAPKGDAWEEAGKLKQARVVHRMVAVNDKLLLAVGGASKGDNVALTESVVAPK
jgi:hypothetical protein